MSKGAYSSESVYHVAGCNDYLAWTCIRVAPVRGQRVVEADQIALPPLETHRVFLVNFSNGSFTESSIIDPSP